MGCFLTLFKNFSRLVDTLKAIRLCLGELPIFDYVMPLYDGQNMGLYPNKLIN